MILLPRVKKKQLRSVVGSLPWIARQPRPDILYRVSKLQSSIKGATVSTLKEAKNVLELALNGMDLKLRCKNRPFNVQELGVLTASDASFAGEPGSRSQQGRIHFLVPAHQLLDPKCCDCAVMIVYDSVTLQYHDQKEYAGQLFKQRRMLCKTPRKLAIGFEPCRPNCMGTAQPAQIGTTPVGEQSPM